MAVSMAQPNFNPGRGGGPMHHNLQKVKLNNPRAAIKRIGTYLAGKRSKLLLVLLFSLAATLVKIVGTRLNGYAIDHCITQKDVRGLAVICGILAVMYIVGVLSDYLQNIIMIRVSQESSANIRKDLFVRMQKLPLSFFDTHGSGDIMSRLTNDVDNINTAMSQTVVQLVSNSIMIIGTLAAMLFLSPFLMVIALLTIPVTYGITRLIISLTQKHFIAQQEDLGKLNSFIEETISGHKVVRLFHQEEANLTAFEVLNDRYVSNSFYAQAISGVTGPMNNMVNNIGYLAVSVVGGVCLIHGQFGITLGIIFSFILYMRNFLGPVNSILNLINTLQLALASAERVFEVIDEQEETDTEQAHDCPPDIGNIRMQEVSFSYVPGKQVLNRATITAKKGEVVAIVGPTGAGKTTIINLLTKFYDIDSGQILIEGEPLENYTRKSLRSSISMVLQDMFLFSDTVRENIRYGRVDATDDDIEQAAKQAEAHEFIMQLPDGYDTLLTDNGMNLSQGQRQLLSIARAILSKASVLILDEATSSIDTRTEIQIQTALLNLMRGKTSFVIAHRLSTIQNADKILVLNQGTVIEEGTHRELMEKNGFYAGMYKSQWK